MKYLKILTLVFLLFLFACNGDSKLDEETVPTEPEVEEIRYTFKISTLESFYHINYQLIEDDQTKLKVSLEPIKAYTDVIGTVSVKVYVSYMFQHINLRSSVTFSFTFENLVEKTETLNNVYEDYQIEYIEVTYASGVIKSFHEITINDKVYNVPPFIPNHIEQFTIDNIEQNQALFLEFEEVIESFSLRGNFDYLTSQMSTRQSITTNNATETETMFQKIQLTNNYLYYENSYEKGIIQTVQDKLFHYYMNPYRIVSNKQVLEVSIIDSFEDINIDFELDSTLEDQLFTPDATKMEIKKIGNSYFITSYVKDMLPYSEYQLLSQQFRSLGVDELVLAKTVILLTFEITEDEFFMVTTMNINLPLSILSRISTRVEMMYSFKPFEKIDIHSDLYIIEPPDEFDEILEETQVTEEIRQELHAFNHKYLVYLEKGQYQFIDVDDQRLAFTFYDLQQNKLYLTQATSNYYQNEVFVPEDGYYYLNIHQTLSNNLGYAFYFEHRNYETTWLDEETLNLGINDIYFEGDHDFVRFKFDSDETKVFKIVSSSNEVMIYPQDYFYADFTHFIEVPSGISYFTLVSFKELHVQLEVILVDHKFYMSDDLNTMETITDTYSNLIVTSSSLGSRYLKLEVTEKALYRLNLMRASESFSLHQIGVYDHRSQFINYLMSSGLILDVGTYYLKFSSTGLALGYAAYEIEPIVYETIELDTTPIEYTDQINSNLTQYQVNLLFKSHYADFHFESEESMAIYVRGSSTFHYQILNHLREPITFVFGTNFYTYENQIFYFEPGSYYLRVFSTWEFPGTTYFWLAFLANPPEDDFKIGSEVPFGQFGENIFRMTYPEDSEVIQMEITVAGLYTFTSNINGYVTIFDASFKLVQSGQNGYQLQPGIYYIYFPNRGGTTRTLHITKK